MEAPPVDRELWAEYAVGALFILTRFAVRAKVIGIKNFGLEDAFMLVALLAYTAVTALIHLITTYGATIGQTAESVYLLPDAVVASMTIGQKLTFADWYIYMVYVWCLKATLLTMFWKLVQGLHKETIAWKVVAAYTAISLFGAALAHTCVCLPVHHSWQVQPYPGGQSPLKASCNGMNSLTPSRSMCSTRSQLLPRHLLQRQLRRGHHLHPLAHYLPCQDPRLAPSSPSLSPLFRSFRRGLRHSPRLLLATRSQPSPNRRRLDLSRDLRRRSCGQHSRHQANFQPHNLVPLPINSGWQLPEWREQSWWKRTGHHWWRGWQGRWVRDGK